jgi:hypothetical protein
MSAQQKYKSSFGFIDLLFNLLVGFTFMFILAFMLINPVAKKHDFDPKAEYMVIMSWDPKSSTDIDMWIQDDLDNIVSFGVKNKGLMNLSVTVTGHWFSKKIDQYTKPETITFELIQLNPYKEVILKKLILNGPGDEVHALGFVITDDGEVELNLDNTDLIVNKADNMNKFKDPFTPGGPG